MWASKNPEAGRASGTASRPEPGNGLLFHSIADAWLPLFPAVDGELRTRITGDTASFLDRRIGAMPLFLSLPVRMILRLLDLESWALRQARFRDAPREWRNARLDAWARSRFPPKAGAARLLRSLILLYFYDHPAVRQAMSGNGGRTT